MNKQEMLGTLTAMGREVVAEYAKRPGDINRLKKAARIVMLAEVSERLGLQGADAFMEEVYREPEAARPNPTQITLDRTKEQKQAATEDTMLAMMRMQGERIMAKAFSE